MYFRAVALPVPLFSESKFYDDYACGRIPTYLLNAMFCLASRFASEASTLHLANNDVLLLGQQFSREAEKEMKQLNMAPASVSVAQVKASCLLVFYHYSCFAMREASEQCSRAVRMAYMCGLHQVDNPNRRGPDASPITLDTEEKRSLWWCIWTLDCFTSITSCLPPSIDDLTLATTFPTCELSKATTVSSLPGKKRSLLDEMDEDWYKLDESESRGTRTQFVLLSASSMAREAACLRRLGLENLQYDLHKRLMCLEKRWRSMMTGLPPWFLVPNRHELDSDPEEHRQRLEAIHLVYV